jgi:hypothetical protein
MSPEEKAQKMIQKVGINTIKSAGTAGAKTYGGNIKNARGESEAPRGYSSDRHIRDGSC